MSRTGNSLTARLRQFFADNPSEELSAEDAAAKFGVADRTAHNRLGVLVGAGVLERVSVYRVKREEPKA